MGRSFGQLVKPIKGKRPKELFDQPATGLVPYLDLAAVELGRKRQWAPPQGVRLVEAGSVVMVWDGARSGWVGITPFAGALGSTLVVLQSPLKARFLAAFLRSKYSEINSNHRGSGIPHVNPEFLNRLEIPELDEVGQDEVATAVEDVGRYARSAVAHLSAVRDATLRFRQAVLLAAADGRLTESWRATADDATSAAELLRERTAASATRKLRRGVDPSAEADVELEMLVPPTWTVVTVARLLSAGALLDVKDGNHGTNHPKSKEFTSDGLPFITANCVADGRINYEAAPKVSGEALARLRVGFAEPGDVILTHKASVGRVAINTERCVLTPQTTYYRPDPEVVSAEYLALYLESLYFYRQLARVMSQTTRDFVPISEQYRLSICLPPPGEQEAVVERAGRLLSLGDAVAQRLAAADRQLDRASRAALHHVLHGERPAA